MVSWQRSSVSGLPPGFTGGWRLGGKAGPGKSLLLKQGGCASEGSLHPGNHACCNGSSACPPDFWSSHKTQCCKLSINVMALNSFPQC